MSTLVLVVALAAAVACPAHMLWRMRRGKQASSLPTRHRTDELSERQARLAEELTRLSADRG